MPKIDESRAFIPVKIAVLTISDTRTEADDKSGQTLVSRLTDAGHILADKVIIKDDVASIQTQVKKWITDKGKSVV